MEKIAKGTFLPYSGVVPPDDARYAKHQSTAYKLMTSAWGTMSSWERDFVETAYCRAVISKKQKSRLGIIYDERIGDKDIDTPWSYGKRVYFALSPTMNLVKIGVAEDPVVRMRGLQTGSPDILSLIGSIKGDVDAERNLHKRFKAFHSHGEWYRNEGELKGYLDEQFCNG